MREKIAEWLNAHTDEMIADLGELVAIRSVKGASAPGAPFGAEPKRALDWMLDKCRQYGFLVDNADNYAGSADLDETPAKLGILVHLDVVPAGDGWMHEPFQLTDEPETGKLIGRGTSDDKGPAIAALYAMRAVRELGLAKGVRLIFGTDEENGSADLAYYMSHRNMPAHVITPDGDYPVITTEKGMIRLKLTADIPEGDLLTLKAGGAVNAVPAAASATFRNGTQRKRMGKNAHASTPELGDNALTGMLQELSETLPDGAQKTFFGQMAACFPYGETDGASLGIADEDMSGKLTCVLSVMDIADGRMTAYCDIRFPLCCKGEDIITAVQGKLAPVQCETILCDAPHHVDEDSSFIQMLLRIYEAYTGEPGACLAIGGGTYVHHIEGGVAFGAVFPGTDVNMHGAEEFILKNHLLLDAQMLAAVMTETF